MSTSDLDDAVEFLSLLVKGIPELDESWDKIFLQLCERCDVHRGWESDWDMLAYEHLFREINQRVVATLAHVDVVIRVYWLLRAKLSAQHLDGTV